MWRAILAHKKVSDIYSKQVPVVILLDSTDSWRAFAWAPTGVIQPPRCLFTQKPSECKYIHYQERNDTRYHYWRQKSPTTSAAAMRPVGCAPLSCSRRTVQLLAEAAIIDDQDDQRTFQKRGLPRHLHRKLRCKTQGVWNRITPAIPGIGKHDVSWPQ